MAKRKAPFLKLLILAVLVVKGSMHGYAIYKDIVFHTKEKWKPSIGTIYRILNEMNREGLLEKKILKSSGRKISQYTITEKGMKVFIETSRPTLIKMSTILTTFIEAYKKLLEERGEKLNKEAVDRLTKLNNAIENYLSLYSNT
ncbi:PadR family transcriptional regulator [Desulfurococcaceae archaeon MEX13E-LK6-19]|nr:PadR family transcriptional regulator [Desulfurococcaceae archaeon MEX13E-LK6-19]